MVNKLFRHDEAFQSWDFGSQGVTTIWTRPHKGEVVPITVNFSDFEGLGLQSDGIIPPEYKDQAFQPVNANLRAFELAVNRMREEIGDAGMQIVRREAADGQQHGSIYWNELAAQRFASLQQGKGLESQLAPCLASRDARIWMTGSSTAERQRMTQSMGDVEKYVRIAGAQPFERYTLTVIADVKSRQPLVLDRTKGIRLVEQLPVMLMTGNFNSPIGYGGACGTAAWDYKLKTWSRQLLKLATGESPDESVPSGLELLLPKIVAPGTAQPVSKWFSTLSGVPETCLVYEPTGDNPGSRVTIRDRMEGGELKPSSLISLGTSVTVNIGLLEEAVDPTGKLALMYDYIGRPFFLACKTNGTGRWDEVKTGRGVDHSEQDRILEAYLSNIIRTEGAKAHAEIFFRYSKRESFPETKPFETRISYERNRGQDVRAVIETCLADIAVHAGPSLPQEPIYVVGGATKSPVILKMLAAMLNRPLLVGKESSEGAAMGSNYAAQFFYLKENKSGVPLGELIGTAAEGKRIEPHPALVRYYHQDGGYLSQFKAIQQEAFRR